VTSSSPENGLRVAVVGLEFGAEFVPIYKAHPNVAEVAIVDQRAGQLHTIGERFGISRRYGSLEAALAAGDIDAVHLVTPVHLHGKHSLAVLQAEKHCACTIPMALSVEELRGIVTLQKQVNRSYMMMETATYTREFLYVQELYRAGRFGRIAFAKAHHLQDMEGWPDYWQGFPPLAHITHALGPVLALLGTRATRVHCFGSGWMPEEMTRRYDNPFPVETGIFQLEGSDVAVEVTRNMFQMARPYSEAFSIYGDRLGFEWPQLEDQKPLLFEMGPRGDGRGRPISVSRIEVPDYAHLLPAEIAPFTRRAVYQGGDHLSFVQGGGHGGSHPHLVHEFVRSIVEGRPARIDAATAANWTVAGLCAHQSALQGGAAVEVPAFQ
jgi:predicted dehydrogenase